MSAANALRPTSGLSTSPSRLPVVGSSARPSASPKQLFGSTGMTEQEAADLRDAVRNLTDALNASLRKEST